MVAAGTDNNTTAALPDNGAFTIPSACLIKILLTFNSERINTGRSGKNNSNCVSLFPSRASEHGKCKPVEKYPNAIAAFIRRWPSSPSFEDREIAFPLTMTQF